MAKTRMTSTRLKIIDVLRMQDGSVTITDVAGALGRPDQNVRQSMSLMVAHGLISTRKGRRPFRYMLTAKGLIARGSFPPKGAINDVTE